MMFLPAGLELVQISFGLEARFIHLPIFVGGITINHPNNSAEFNTTYFYVIKDMVLADAIKLIKSTILQIQEKNMRLHRKYQPK
jgi:hypothetical protein